MSLEVLRTKKKAMLNNNTRWLRLSQSIEGMYFIFLEEYTEQDMLKRKKMLWNGEYETDANIHFEHYKWDCQCGNNKPGENNEQ